MVIIKWPYAAMRNTLCVTLLHIAGLAVEGNSQEHWTQFAMSTWWGHTCVRLITNILTSSRQSWRSKQVKLLQISSPPHLFFSYCIHLISTYIWKLLLHVPISPVWSRNRAWILIVNSRDTGLKEVVVIPFHIYGQCQVAFFFSFKQIFKCSIVWFL